MKNILTTLLLLSSFICFAQPNVDSMLTKAQFGGLYITFELSTNNNSDSTYFAVIPPIFETYIDSIKIKEKAYGNVEVVYVTTSNVYEKTPMTSIWEISELNEKIKERCIDKASFPNKPNLTLCKKEVNAEYITKDLLLIETFSGKLDSTYYEYLKIEKQRKISDGAIKLLSNKDEVLHPKQTIVAIPNSSWSDFKSIICPIKVANKIIEIQKALNKKGFPCPINGILGSQTKAALVNFQKSINYTPSCRGADNGVFKALGISGY
jgi:hypothetical protein